MESGSEAPLPTMNWSTKPFWAVCFLLLGLAAAGLAVTAGSVPGAFLYGVAGLVLLGTGVAQLVRRPRLQVVDGLLVIALLRGRRIIERRSVIEVRALSLARLAGRSHVLRIEYRDESGAEQMEILTRMDLGADPRDVSDALVRRGFTGNLSTEN